MISFNLTALTRETPSIQRKEETRNIFPQQNPPKFYPTFIHSFNLQQKQSFYFKFIIFNHGTKFFQETSHGRHVLHIPYRRRRGTYGHGTDIFLHLRTNKPNAFILTRLTSSYLHNWNNGQIRASETVFYSPTPNTSMISDDEDLTNPTPIIGNPQQYTPQIPPRRNHPIQLCQQVQPIPHTPQSPSPENRGQSDDSYPANIPLNNPPPLSRQYLINYET